MHARLTADRQTLRDREESLSKSEQTLTSLQEQLRRRSEELSERQQAQTVEEQRLRDEAARLEEQAKIAEQERQIKATDLENSQGIVRPRRGDGRLESGTSSGRGGQTQAERLASRSSR